VRLIEATAPNKDEQRSSSRTGRLSLTPASGPSPPAPLPQSRERGERNQPASQWDRKAQRCIFPSPGFAGEGLGVRVHFSESRAALDSPLTWSATVGMLEIESRPQPEPPAHSGDHFDVALNLPGLPRPCAVGFDQLRALRDARAAVFGMQRLRGVSRLLIGRVAGGELQTVFGHGPLPGLPGAQTQLEYERAECLSPAFGRKAGVRPAKAGTPTRVVRNSGR
jgi:hypothetical protein